MKNKIIRSLRENLPSLRGVTSEDLEVVQERAYRLLIAPPWFVKWIPADDELGQNEIKVDQTVLQGWESVAPRLLHVLHLEDGVIGCWEWLDGDDLRYHWRDLLPRAFAKLGRFHLAHRYSGEVFSLVTQEVYGSPKELLEAEYQLLCSYHGERMAREAKPYFSLLLEVGFPTQIHGDLHPGNIRLHAGDVRLVDWGYSRRSLNLFDLSYVEAIRQEPVDLEEWWIITPEESLGVLSAYGAVVGVPAEKMLQVQHAVMVWAKLWAYHNSVRHGNKSAAERSRQQIVQVLGLS